jgi:hypothetical protein
VEGIRQFAASARSSNAVGNFENFSETKSSSTIKNLDIASITLKELENLLAEHNKMREVNLRLDEKPKLKKPKKVEMKPEPAVVEVKVDPVPVPAKIKVEPAPNITKDEKQVESVMNFITNYDRQPISQPDTDTKGSVLEVNCAKIVQELRS